MRRISILLFTGLLVVACAFSQEIPDDKIIVEQTEWIDADEQETEALVVEQETDETAVEAPPPDTSQQAGESIHDDAIQTNPDIPSDEQTQGQTRLITLLTFDDTLAPEHIAGFGAPITFERQTPGFVDGHEVAPHAPRFVEGKFGKGLLLEEQRANLLSLNQSDAEKGTDGFTALGESALATVTTEKWQGTQSLQITTPGNTTEEGFLVQSQVERGWYNGLNIMPSVYVGSLYAKGEGCLQLFLKDLESGEMSDPLFFCLSDEWQRFSCLFSYKLESVSIGRNLGENWRKHIPEGTSLDTHLQLVCVTTDKQKIQFLVDGLALERRNMAYPAQGRTISPLTWIPGGINTAQEMLKISTSNDFFTKWRQEGTISFWFKPNWSVNDGTRETILHMGPASCLIDHTGGRFRISHANISFIPFEWEHKWHHIAITWDSEGKHILYLDGFEYPSDRPFNNKTTFLAFFLGDTVPNGVLDDFALFETALTEEQIRAMAFDEKPAQP